MAQESLSLEGSKAAKPISVPWQGSSLKWKISSTFSSLILVFGLAIIAIVYYLNATAFRNQIDQRAHAIASNLSDVAAGHLSRRNSLELDALAAKYGRLDGVAFAYIQDGKGEIAASSLQPFPPELRQTATFESNRTSGSRTVLLRGRSVYETRVPILEGQLGTARIGFWADAVHQEVWNVLFPLGALTVLCLLLGIGLAVMLASKTVRPILELAQTADQISRGHLDTNVSVNSTDEVGELARSLERMRASLKAAMTRLSRE